MPVVVLGWEYAGTFWKANWYLILVFFAALAVLNAYFLRNRKLFSALERESWDDVIGVLERRIYENNTLSVVNIRTLVNSYVVTSRTEEISRLEQHLEANAPAVLNKTCLLFGVTHILTSKGEEIERYYGRFLDRSSGTVHDWVVWHHAFGILLQERFSEGRETLLKLAGKKTPDLLTACTLYLLDSFTGPDYESDEVKQKIAQLREKYTSRTWKRLVEKNANELHLLVLSRLLRDVENWLFHEE